MKDETRIPGYRSLTPEELDEMVRRARALRTQAVRDALRWVATRLVAGRARPARRRPSGGDRLPSPHREGAAAGSAG